MLNLKAGQSGTVIATYQDNTQTPPVSYPLASAATATVDNPAVTLVQTKDGTTDGIANWTATAAAGATPGPFTITTLGQGLADGSDPIPGTLGGSILANDDNSVVMSSTVP